MKLRQVLLILKILVPRQRQVYLNVKQRFGDGNKAVTHCSMMPSQTMTSSSWMADYFSIAKIGIWSMADLQVTLPKMRMKNCWRPLQKTTPFNWFIKMRKLWDLSSMSMMASIVCIMVNFMIFRWTILNKTQSYIFLAFKSIFDFYRSNFNNIFVSISASPHKYSHSKIVFYIHLNVMVMLVIFKE